MAKITPLSDVVNLQSESTAVQTINENSDKIEAAFQNTLSRDGSTPNTMGASLDMNSNRILNVGAPQAAGDAVNRDYVDQSLGGLTPELITDITGLPQMVEESQQAAADAAARRKEELAPTTKTEIGKKKGGCVKKMAKGGYVRSADGCAQRGKTRGKMV